ncbi:MAG: hypothetical protein DME82_05210 [Verrucomicrobia bacterium]|nr:MAG: hypothetical protein DME82_05210 [Verrucomicrobiota bacterium]
MIPSLLYSLFCSASGHRKRPCSKPKCAAVSILFLPVQVAKFDDRNAAAVHVSQGRSIGVVEVRPTGCDRAGAAQRLLKMMLTYSCGFR